MAQGEIAAFPTFPRNFHQHEGGDDSCNIYSQIRQQYGNETLQLLKHFSKLNVTLAKQKNRRIFLLRCKHLEVTPTFLNFRTQHVTFQCKYLSDEFETLYRKFKLNTLNLLISDTCKNIRALERELALLENNINRSISYALFSSFLNFEKQRHENFFTKIKHRNIKKINNLYNRSKTNLQNNTFLMANILKTYQTQNYLTMPNKFYH